MVINELQIGLTVAGLAVVAAIFAFNKWQERRHQKMAQDMFGQDSPDVLLDKKPNDGEEDELPNVTIRSHIPDAAVSHEVPSSRDLYAQREPAPVAPAPAVAPMPDYEPLPEYEEPVPAPAPAYVPPVAEPVSMPLLSELRSVPVGVDERVDCLARLDMQEAVPVPLFWPAQQDALPRCSRVMQWFGFNDKRNEWERVGSHNQNRYAHWCVALQLVDRRGPISVPELQAFVQGVDSLAGRFKGEPEFTDLQAAMYQAQDLDNFCAQVDVQVGFNVMSKSGGQFAGTKLRGLAEAAGLTLQADGSFHAKDDHGRTLFALSNVTQQPFSPEGLRSTMTIGVSLNLDVPRVPDGASVLSRMFLVAQQMANALGGSVVDDNGEVLDDRAVTPIRAKVQEFQHSMMARGLQPGSGISMRLFS